MCLKLKLLQIGFLQILLELLTALEEELHIVVLHIQQLLLVPQWAVSQFLVE